VSRRYTDENISFYIPPEDDFRKQAIKNKQASEGRFDDVSGAMLADGMRDAISEAYGHYLGLLEAGVAREQARAVLPQSLVTSFYMTGDLRNWAHFIKLRLDGHAQKEAQVVAQKVYEIALEKFPVATKALLGV
jgi:thymidylate synthase (FAD)